MESESREVGLQKRKLRKMGSQGELGKMGSQRGTGKMGSQERK
jgi:hypothetical protein